MWEVVMIFLNKIKLKAGSFQISVLQLTVSFVIGILIANVSKAAYSPNSQYIETLVYMDLKQINKLHLLIYILQYRIKEYLLIWLFSVTILATVYNTIFILYKGFTAGFVIGVLATLSGWKGAFCGMGLGFPHYLVYVIVLLQTVKMSYKMHENYTSGIYGKRSRLFMKQIPAFLVLLSFTITGCFMETFLNPPILAWLRTALKLI